MGQGVVGIKAERPLEDADGTFDVLGFIVILQVAAPLQIEIIGAGDLRAVDLECSTLLWLQLQLQHLHRACRHAVLQRKRIGDVSGDRFRPDLPPCTGVHECVIHTHRVPRAVHCAFQTQACSQLLACLLGAGDAARADFPPRSHLQLVRGS